ncbi:MAG: acetoin dehydrogenase dihydrolipoyllysine-residue acetyltransferase subunit [Pseudomonadota bacterium]
MPTEVIMPKVDMDMAAGTLSVWHIGDGGAVEAGAPLFDIETDKAAMEVEAPASGILMHVAAAGSEVPIGQPVGWIFAEGEPRLTQTPGHAQAAQLDASSPAEDPPLLLRATDAVADTAVASAVDAAVASVVASEVDTAVDAVVDAVVASEIDAAVDAAVDAVVDAAVDAPLGDAKPASGPDAPAPAAAPAKKTAQPDRPRATPAARKAAAAARIALADLTGSGPRGRVQLADVLAATQPGDASDGLEPDAHRRASAEPRGQDAPGPKAALAETDAAKLRPAEPRIAPAAHATQHATQNAAQNATQHAAQNEAPPDHAGLLRSGHGDGTPFLLLHGFAADAGIWSALEPRLPRGHPVLKLELPGHGRAGAAQIDGFAALVAHMRRAWDALDLDAVHVVGHSLGGALALALADTRPRQIASLTLLCPAGLGPDINGPVLDGICRSTGPESLAPWLRQLVADPETISWGYVRAAAAARTDAQRREAQARLSSVLFPDGTQAFDLTAALQRLSCPTRLIWGKRDAIIPWRHALSAPGRVALHLFDGVGHLPQIEARDEIAGLLAQFP